MKSYVYNRVRDTEYSYCDKCRKIHSRYDEDCPDFDGTINKNLR